MSLERTGWIGADQGVVDDHRTVAPGPHVGHTGLRLCVVTRDGMLPADIGHAARTLRCDVVLRGFAALHNDDLPGDADLYWYAIDGGCDAALVNALADQIAITPTPTILDCTTEALDAFWGALGDNDDVTIVQRPSAVECVATLAGAARSLGQHVSAPGDEEHAKHIARLQEEVARIARLLARLATEDMAGAAPGPSFAGKPADDQVQAAARAYRAKSGLETASEPVAARDIRRLIRIRRMRDELFPAEMFADPAWDMLLDLFAARLEQAQVSVSSLCIAAAVPATTALRWIKTLTDDGTFVRESDPRDGRRVFVALSERSLFAMTRYFQRVQEI